MQPTHIEGATYDLWKVEPWHVAHIARNMRKADRAEVKAASGLSPLDCLNQGVDISDYCATMKDPLNTFPVCIFGVVKLKVGGAIWLLGTEDIKRFRFTLHSVMHPLLDALNRRYGRLSNLVDARNKVHIRYLQAAKFTLGSPVLAGVEQRPFIPFYRDPTYV